MSLRPYIAGFRLAMARELTYRANFLFGRLRELIIFSALLFLFQAIPNTIGGYDHDHIATYFILGTFLSSLVLVFGMHNMAGEIADGDLTNYLLRPINYFGFWFARLAATRCLTVVVGIFQIIILLVLFPSIHLVRPTSTHIVLATLVMFFGGLITVHILDFIGATFSFWTHRGHGTRWLIMVLIQFLCGAYLPLDLFPKIIQDILLATPFPSIVYLPIKTYLGDLTSPMIVHAIIFQWVWNLILGTLCLLLWKRGVKTYEAYGR